MQPSNVAFWCYMFLLIVSSMKSRGHSTNGDDSNNFSRYHLGNSTRDRDDKMLYEIHRNFTKNDREDSDFVLHTSHERIMKNHEETNETESYVSTEINDKRVFTLQKIDKSLMKFENKSNTTSYDLYENSNTDDYNNNIIIALIPYEACENNSCLQLCCPFGEHLTYQKNCAVGQNNYSFPNLYENKNESEDKKLDQLFQMTVHDPCIAEGYELRILEPNEYSFLNDGSLYQTPNQIIPSTSYCLAIMKRNIYDVFVCKKLIKVPLFINICLLISVPFLLLTFIVYSILPELQNMHGHTLRGHIASLFVTYVILYFFHEVRDLHLSKICIPLAYTFNFFFLASFFWLTMTCFDIWWTFRKLRSRQQNLKHKEKKKFILYSISAWGISLFLTGLCAFMDYVPGIPDHKAIKPKMCESKFWYNRDLAKVLYFFVPTAISVISNICFFIATIVIIVYQNKNTDHQLRDSAKKYYDENMQRFRTYLKLFIVMGINWIVSWIFAILEILWWYDVGPILAIIWYPIDTINALQGLIIFVYLCVEERSCDSYYNILVGKNAMLQNYHFSRV
ncbi:G-protein coupled receptor Mth2-like [Pogonomyrmex barbatus]|uniref:G-protein coupled receptor Mth2-like n=1 Tax=Pogonomyrmex barbatus TaxID=144034 RepID=A0A6I9WS69_9HYME|nr:G-protein coupled receptor Mth2-like [Pogonomyrmex barbatus]